MGKSVESVLKSIISDTFEENSSIEDIGLDSPLNDIGINSISFIKIVVAIESEFNIEFEDEYLEYSKWNTLNDIISYIDYLRKECGGYAD